MNLVFISHGLKDPEAWRLALGIEKFIHFPYEDKLQGFAQIALLLDKLVWIEKYPVDWMLYCNNEKGIKWSEFQSMKEYIDKNSDCLFLTQTFTDKTGRTLPDLDGNFYCRPHVFTILGNSYKLNNSVIENTDVSNKNLARLCYSIARSGCDIKLI